MVFVVVAFNNSDSVGTAGTARAGIQDVHLSRADFIDALQSQREIEKLNRMIRLPMIEWEYPFEFSVDDHDIQCQHWRQYVLDLWLPLGWDRLTIEETRHGDDRYSVSKNRS